MKKKVTTNESVCFLRDEDNVERVYACASYLDILILAARKRLNWQQFKTAIESIGLNYGEMKAAQRTDELGRC